MALELDNYLITGRTFEEYAAFFGLDSTTLEGKKVLDCPSGVSGFVAQAQAQGIEAIGCDQLYQYDPADVVKQGSWSIEKIYADQSWMYGCDFNFYGSIEAHRLHREKALRLFMRDFNETSYIYATLPQLPFAEKSFDLILSSHLLFVYDDRLDLDFHLDSIKEMLRVSKEVRIYPLIDYKNSRADQEENFSPWVYEVMKRFDAKITEVPYLFHRKSNYMMQIK